VIHIEDLVYESRDKIISQDRREGFMIVSFFFALYKKSSTIFQSEKFVQPPTRSLDSSVDEIWWG
jgi:hypothetical protein